MNVKARHGAFYFLTLRWLFKMWVCVPIITSLRGTWCV